MDRTCASNGDMDLGLVAPCGGVAHNGLAHSHVDHDVVRCEIGVALLQRSEGCLAGLTLGVDRRVGDMSGVVIGRRNEADPVSLLERAPGESGGVSRR